MKLLVFDVEGTIFEAKYKIEGTDYSSTLWQPIAHSLGEAAEQEERETHIKWKNKEYSNYMEWVQAR
jgi:phosphoserine phosphatase